jgi:hypothetical protein
VKIEVVDIMKNVFFSAIASAAIYDDCMVLWSGFGNVCVEFATGRPIRRVSLLEMLIIGLFYGTFYLSWGRDK